MFSDRESEKCIKGRGKRGANGSGETKGKGKRTWVMYEKIEE